MTQTAGYSGTPLAKKLGLQDGQVAGFVGLPDTVKHLLTSRAFAFVENCDDWRDLSDAAFDYLHLFTDAAQTVHDSVPNLRDMIKPNGMIWVSWPKKASKVQTDITEDTIRDFALTQDLVDIKVCAVDDIWSGLKIVIRKELRDKYMNA